MKQAMKMAEEMPFHCGQWKRFGPRVLGSGNVKRCVGCSLGQWCHYERINPSLPFNNLFPCPYVVLVVCGPWTIKRKPYCIYICAFDLENTTKKTPVSALTFDKYVANAIGRIDRAITYVQHEYFKIFAIAALEFVRGGRGENASQCSDKMETNENWLRSKMHLKRSRWPHAHGDRDGKATTPLSQSS